MTQERVEPAPGAASGVVAGRDVYQQGTYVAGRDISVVIQRSAPPAACHQLPPDIAEFTGRDDCVAALSDILRRAGRPHTTAPPIVLIQNGPGVGKSALALHLAHRVAPDFPDAQLHLQLSGENLATMPPSAALDRLLRALGVDADAIPADRDERAALYRSRLADQRALVVLDNAMSEDQVRPLLPGVRSCAVLITSRHQLEGLHGVHSEELSRLPDSEAIELLGRLIGQERVDSDRKAAAAIVGMCGNLPLGIQLAAGTLRTTAKRRMRLSAFAAQLSDERRRLDLLRAGDRELRASFALSYSTLSDGAAHLFRLMGLLRVPDMGPEVLGALADLDDVQAEPVRDEIVNAHLVELTGPEGDRYRFHDLLRLFARECAEQDEPAAERDAAVRRAVDWYLAGAGEADGYLDPAAPKESTGSESRIDRALNWFELERPALTAIVRQAHDLGMHEASLRLAIHLSRFFELRNYWNDWVSTHEVAVQAARAAGDGAGEARILVSLATTYRLWRRSNEAITSLERAVALFRELGDRGGESGALSELGIAYRELHRLDEAVACYERALATFRELQDRLGEGNALNNIGHVYRLRRRPDECRAYHENALMIFQEIENLHGQCWALNNLIAANLLDRRFNEALERYGQALAVVQKLGYTHAEAWAHNHAGVAYRELYRLDEAIASHDRALSIFRRLGDQYGEGWALNYLGATCRLAGQAQATAHHRQALEVFRRIGEQNGEGWALNGLGTIDRLEARLDDAASCHEQALRCFRAVRQLNGEGWALHELGMVRAAQHRPQEALAEFEQALAAFREISDRHGEATTLEGLALAREAAGGTARPHE